LSAGVGSYIGAYLKKKGENLATHEDLEKVLVEVRATTKATKEIEAKITDEVWGRQQRWQMKRDVLFAATNKISAVKDALTSLYSIYETDRKGLATDTAERNAKREKANVDFNDAVDELDEAALQIDLGKAASEF
jgi:hypothetical protein